MITFFLSFLALFAVWIASLRMLDRLIRLEYASYRERWEEDGKPDGVFFHPPEARALGGLVPRPGSWLASQRCSIVWLFGTPEWTRQDRRALRLVFWLRVFAFTFGAGLVGVIGLMFYILPRG